jgi:hypothetical protein
MLFGIVHNPHFHPKKTFELTSDPSQFAAAALSVVIALFYVSTK